MSDYAKFIPAINQTYNKFVADGKPLSRPIGSLTKQDFNLLVPNSRLFVDTVLYSARYGWDDSNLKTDTMTSQRDRSATTLFGDSGGFSIINDAVKVPYDVFRQRSLDWLEQCCDVGPILDIPLLAIKKQSKVYKTFQDCLNLTVDNAKWASDKRNNSAFKLLGVIHGRNLPEAQQWYNAIKPYNFNGYALAGSLRSNPKNTMLILRDIIASGEIQHIAWIHFFGTARLDYAVLFTAIQRALRRFKSDIVVTFDSAIPFEAVSSYKRIPTSVHFDKKSLRVLNWQLPKAHKWVGDPSAPFPFWSTITRDLTVDEVIPQNLINEYMAGDTLTNYILNHYSTERYIELIKEANRIVDAGLGLYDNVPDRIKKVVDTIDRFFKDIRNTKVLDDCTGIAEMVKSGKQDNEYDDLI